ncbi:hypothetical protein TOPH_07072 [Tolypocladium ophioglossoides CBS 100239]|uniref:DUF7053 domain-containing protein n=1 Tax=Tolypocladium ophioglossoides (strain CBS 100239) TaxID=1163406 RepID=A0A0L0N2Q4_TOLOC|nr:hypothetical protein TOPH_07072 [Tolypocladium ophioglossoides CBS 100239]
MLRKKEAFTVVTPIPGFIPRQLALDILHSHSEVITLNPLVLEHRPIPAPRTAAADEFYSTWYEIVERIQYVPGMGRAGSGRITFSGCFHDMPWGLQTHIYAPLGVDLRNRYRIAGNQPGLEPPEHREIGLEALGAPADGLYLREDIEIKCNIAMVGFVMSQLKAASKDMVQRIIKKAELLDAGVLQGMMEDGVLRTINPNDRSQTSVERANSALIPSPGPPSPRVLSPPPVGVRPDATARLYQSPGYQSPGYQSPGPYQHYHGQYAPPPPIPPKEQFAPVELPGDLHHYPRPQSLALQPPRPVSGVHSYGYRDSVSSSDPRWSQVQPSPSLPDTHRTSVSSVASSGYGHPSPGQQRQGFATELAAHSETAEEYGRRVSR